MIEVVAADIGGTHARFAIAEIEGERVHALGAPVTLKTIEHASLDDAWAEFGRRLGRRLPTDAGIAVASPIGGDVLKLTNSSWVIRPAAIPAALSVERLTLVNDFGAVAHAVAQLGDDSFAPLCGPEVPLPREGVISIVGPGTGLGVAQLIRRRDGYDVVETEGGHIDFAPLDGLEDLLLAQLRGRFGRVSVERVASGRGLVNIHDALAAIERHAPWQGDERALWMAALAGERPASKALDRFCLTLGAVCGDIALAQGACGLVVAGGVGLRLAGHLPHSGFRDRFISKGRFVDRMDALPVRIITHPEPGLFGAAAAFAAQHGD